MGQYAHGTSGKVDGGASLGKLRLLTELGGLRELKGLGWFIGRLAFAQKQRAAREHKVRTDPGALSGHSVARFVG